MQFAKKTISIISYWIIRKFSKSSSYVLWNLLISPRKNQGLLWFIIWRHLVAEFWTVKSQTFCDLDFKTFIFLYQYFLRSETKTIFLNRTINSLQLYLTIARPELTQQLFTHAMERLNESSDDPEDPFIKESILDLIRALVPYQSLENVEVLYQECIRTLPEITNKKEQKKAYRLLEEICSSESESCKDFVKTNRKEVQKLLMKSLKTAATSSRSARLRCLNFLIKVSVIIPSANSV